jgi:hypothetical protein
MKKGPPQPPVQQGKGNTKSPQEIQAETAVEGAKLQAQQQQTAAKAQTDQQANATKLISAQIEAQADRERAAAENQLRITELALRGREMVGKEALDQARLARIEARNTQGLV